jgi:putative toxin-antitoxin system antitoxin component (TIGR02293 family)
MSITMSKLVANSDVKLDKAVKLYALKVERDTNFNLVDKNVTYKKFLSDRMLIVHSIRRGLPYELYDLIKQRAPFKEDEWAEFLGVSTRTLHRNKATKDFYFDSIPSEKILELAEVTALGKDVFDTEEQFYQWLITPSFALGSLKPIQLLKDSFGKEMVMNELRKIDLGLFS